jgi:ABC-type nitrate/sulfonate/bicarbonate transport system substrate-binding protein
MAAGRSSRLARSTPGRTPARLGLALGLALAVLGGACSPQPAPSAPAKAPPASAPAAPAGAPAGVPAPAAAAPAPAPAAPPELVPARIAYAGSASMLVLWATQEGGYFAKYGLKVDELQGVSASPIAAQALVAGELEFAAIGGDTPVQANLSAGSSELVMVANTSPTIGFFVYLRPEYNALEDVRGKVLAANRPGTNTNFAATRFLRGQGWEAGRDIQILPVGLSPAILTAMDVNQAQAGMLTTPTTLKARQLGMKELADLRSIPFNTNGPIIRRAMLQENRPLVRRYLQATLDAIARVRQDKEFAKYAYGKWANLEDDEALEEMYRIYRPNEIPWVSREGVVASLEDALERHPAAATADPDTFMDNSVLAELEAEGFVARLYGR